MFGHEWTQNDDVGAVSALWAFHTASWHVQETVIEPGGALFRFLFLFYAH